MLWNKQDYPSECVAARDTGVRLTVCVLPWFVLRVSHGGKEHFCIVLKIVLTSWTKKNLRKFEGSWDGAPRLFEVS